MNPYRTGLGLRVLGFLWLFASQAGGQTTVGDDAVLDLPAAVALAHAREPLQSRTGDKRDAALDDISHQQHRQRLFRNIAVGSDVIRTAANIRIGGAGSCTTNSGWSVPVAVGGQSGNGGASTVGGFLGLLKQQRQVANAQQTFDVELRMLTRLKADLTAGLIGLGQVDFCRQSIQTALANLLGLRVSLESAKDRFKVDELGVPQDLPIVLDDSMIRQFDLVDSRTDALQTSLAELRQSIVDPQDDLTVEELSQATERLARLRAEIGAMLPGVRTEFDALVTKAKARICAMTDDERQSFAMERTCLAEHLVDLESRFAESLARRGALRANLVSANLDETAQGLAAYCDCLSNLTCQISLVRSLARLESITIEPIEISSVDALKIAHSHRLDFLNECAALGEMRQSIAGHENAEEVAVYRKARRALVQAEDRLNAALRQNLRVLVQQQRNFEISRMALAISLRRVALAWEALNESAPEARPEDPITRHGSNASANLLSALQALSDSQDNMLAVYLQHYKNRIDLFQDLGIMRFDERGMWIDEPLDRNLTTVEALYAVPPEIAEPRPDVGDERAVPRDVSSEK